MSIDRTALALCVTFSILAVLSVIARFVSRIVSKVACATDDWLIIPALILSLGNAANVLWAAIVSNLGQHEVIGPDGRPELGNQLVDLQLTGYISEIVVTSAITFARLSVVAFYIRIFQGSKFRKWAYVVGSFNLLFGLIFVCIFAFQCSPINEFWLVPHDLRTHCINPIVNVPYAILSIFFDVAILIMPWPMVWGLQLQTKQKIAVLGIFMLGGVVVAVTIGKAFAFSTVFKILATSEDFSYDDAPLLYWTVPECCLSVVCACLPTLRPLFRNMSPESVFRSFRQFFSLRSFTSRSRDDSGFDLDSKISRRQASHHGTTRTGGPFASDRAGESAERFNKSSHSDVSRDGVIYQTTKIHVESSGHVRDLESGDYGVPTQRGLETQANRL